MKRYKRYVILPAIQSQQYLNFIINFGDQNIFCLQRCLTQFSYNLYLITLLYIRGMRNNISKNVQFGDSNNKEDTERKLLIDTSRSGATTDREVNKTPEAVFKKTNEKAPRILSPMNKLRQDLNQGSDEVILDTDSDDGAANKQDYNSRVDRTAEEAEEKKALDAKIKAQKKQHQEFTQDWSKFLELQGQIKFDHDRFKTTTYSAQSPKLEDLKDQEDGEGEGEEEEEIKEETENPPDAEVNAEDDELNKEIEQNQGPQEEIKVEEQKIERKPTEVKAIKESGRVDKKPTLRQETAPSKPTQPAYKAPFDFNTLLKNEKLANSVEYPFSNVHIEDQIFLVNLDDCAGGGHKHYIFALECVFYMSDCHYMPLEPLNFEYNGVKVPSNVNRMGTENYKLADFEENTDMGTFRSAAINLAANRRETYTHQIKDNLMKTQNSEAMIEYYITKWEYNPSGQLRKVAQSDSFKFANSRFLPHKQGQMELQQTANAKYIYIVNEQEKNYQVLAWGVDELDSVIMKNKDDSKEGWNEVIDRIIKVNTYLKASGPYGDKRFLTKKEQDVPGEMRLVCNCAFLETRFVGPDSVLENYELYDIDQGKKIFEFDCRFLQQGSDSKITWTPKIKGPYDKVIPSNDPNEKDQKIEEENKDKHFIFPIKVQLQESVESYQSEVPDVKILFMHNRCSKFKESKFSGFPSIWVDVGVIVEDDDTIKIPHKNEIIETAKKKFDEELGKYVDNIIAIQKKKDQEKKGKEADSKDKKQPEKKGFFSKREQLEEDKKAEEAPPEYRIDGNFFVLQNVLFNEKNSEANPILSTQIVANHDFSYTNVFKLGTNQQYWMYNKVEAAKDQRLDSEEYINVKKLGLKGTIHRMRNQELKPNAYCVFKSYDNEITFNCFFSKDQVIKKKQLKLKNNHKHVHPDAIILSHQRDPDVGSEASKLGVLSLEQYSQNLVFKVFQPEEGKLEMNMLSNRVPVTQRISAQYPCLATNLGEDTLTFHINLSTTNPKALIYQLCQGQEDTDKDEVKDKEKEGETFLDFIEMNDFKKLDLDESAINIDTCSRFVFLTQSLKVYSEKSKIAPKAKSDLSKTVLDQTKLPEEKPKTYRKVWVNIMVIDPYNRIPQAALFKSTKIFKLYDEDNCLDVMETCLLFPIDGNLNLIAQYPLGLYHQALVEPDNEAKQATQEEIEDIGPEQKIVKDQLEAGVEQEMHDANTHQQAKDQWKNQNPLDGEKPVQDLNDQDPAQSVVIEKAQEDENVEIPQSQNHETRTNYVLESESDDYGEEAPVATKKTVSLSEQLKGDVAPVAIFQDRERLKSLIYFVTINKQVINGLEVKQIEIKQYDALKNKVMQILTLREEKILGFYQLLDGRFVIIDDEGQINLFAKNKSGTMLEKEGILHVHPKDTKYIKDSIDDFERIVIENEFMILKEKIIYLQPRRQDVIEGILESQHLQAETRSDYPQYLTKGPFLNKGQKSFIEMFLYCDSGDIDYFLYKQRVFRNPNSSKKKLINDFNKSCELSTFLDNGNILSRFGHRYFTFNDQGTPLNEIKFKGQPINKGGSFYKNHDQCYYALYWQDFKMQDDTGINKKIFIPEKTLTLEEFKKKVDPKPQDEKLKKKTWKTLKIDAVEDSKELKAAKEFKDILKKNNKHLAYVIVEVDQNLGLKFHDWSQSGSYWHEMLVKQATKEYFQRYELVTMCINNHYFLFFNNFLQRFELWELKDNTSQTIINFLKTHCKEAEAKLKKARMDAIEKKFKDKNFKDKSIQNNEEIPEKIFQNLLHQYPEWVYPPQELPKNKQEQYIRKFLKPLQLDRLRTKIFTEADPESWSIHQIQNLLNKDKVKFNTVLPDTEIIIELKKPQQISALGLQSANNFPHLDPTQVKITYILSDKTEEKSESYKHDLEFKDRFEILNFIKPNPDELVSKIKLNFVTSDKKYDKTIKMQLQQILIYEKRTKFVQGFKKLRNLDFWTYNDERKAELAINRDIANQDKDNMFTRLGDCLFNNSDPKNQDFKEGKPLPKHSYIAFLQQSNVVKHIEFSKTVSSSQVRVIFTYCDQDLKEGRKGKLNIFGCSFVHDVYDEYEGYQKKETNVLEPVYFTYDFKIDAEKQMQSAKIIEAKIEKLKYQNELAFLEQQGLPSHSKDFEMLNQIKIDQRKYIYKYSQMVSIMFGKKWAIIKESQNVFGIQMANLLSSTKEFKKASMFQINKAFKMNSDPDEEEENTSVQKISFKLPNPKSQVLDIQFLQSGSKESKQSEIDDLIQIIAMDNQNKVLVIATWNVQKDEEVSMHQIVCENDYPLSIILRGIVTQKDAKRGNDTLTYVQGQNNFLLQDDMIIDLKSGVPFLHSSRSQKYSHKYHKSYTLLFPAIKKIFSDSTRHLGVSKPHHLVVDHSIMDTQLMVDILKSGNAVEILEKFDNILPLFRKKYFGQSLFHYFAGDDSMAGNGVIAMVFEQYMRAKETNQLTDNSVSQMPLFILSPDDKRYGALEIAILQKKPSSFEMMVAMLRDFGDICSSKMMLSNFQNMISIEALDYFDKTQYNPPLLQLPFVVNWPDDAEQIVFTSQTSLVDQGQIDDEIDRYTEDQKVWIKEQFIRLVDWISWTFEEIFLFVTLQKFVNIKKGNKKVEEKFELQLGGDSSTNNNRRITVQALDFDWIFDGENTYNFIELLAGQSNNVVFEQHTIKVFVELMWQNYRPKILKKEFAPFCCKLFCFFMLTSCLQLNLINQIALFTVDEDGNKQTVQDKPSNYTFLMIYQVVFQILLIIFHIQYLWTEFKQYKRLGRMNYLSSFWNIWGMITEGLCILTNVLLWHILIAHGDDGINQVYQRDIRQIQAFAIFALWTKMFYWMGLWPEPAYFLVQLSKTITAVAGFITLFFFVLVAFANFYFILQQNLDEGGWVDDGDDHNPTASYNYLEGAIENPYADAFINMYLLSLGEFFSMDGYNGGHNRKSAWFMFLLASVILLLMFMNMVIAVMSEPFEDVKNSKVAYQLQQQIEFIVDFLDLINIKKKFAGQKYIMVIKPEAVEAEVARSLDDIVEANTQKINKVMQHLFKASEDNRKILEKLTQVEKDVNYINTQNQLEKKERDEEKKKKEQAAAAAHKQGAGDFFPSSMVLETLQNTNKPGGQPRFENPRASVVGGSTKQWWQLK